MLKRTQPFLFKMTTGEYLQLKRTAKMAGLSVAGLIRKCCLTNDRIVVIDRNVIGKIYAELNRIGNNVNQIAHIANTDKRIAPESIRRIEQYMDEIKRVYDEKMRAL